MNLAGVSILLGIMLVLQPTMIYGSKGLTKKHHSLTYENEELVRNVRGAGDSAGTPIVAAAPDSSAASDVSGTLASNVSNAGGSGKRGKNSKKLNKGHNGQNSPLSGSSSLSSPPSSSSSKKHISSHLEKKQLPSSSASSSHHHHQQQQQQHPLQQPQHTKPKQRQNIRSHQTHGKRNGGTKSSTSSVAVNSEKTQSTCRYSKTPWTECDATTNSKSRTLTLKSADTNNNNCLPSRTIEKKCKKNCRYEKGTWSECIAGEMSRQDKLKSTGDSSCEPVRTIKKDCNPAKGSKTKKERKNKDKAARRTQS